MSFVGMLLAAFCGWIFAELMARQSSDVIVAVAAMVIGTLGGFAITIAVMFAFDFLDEVPKLEWSLLVAGDGAIIGSLVGALTGSLNGRRVAKRLGR